MSKLDLRRPEAASPTRLCADIEHVDWLALIEVFERAPLGKRDPKLLEQSFRNSSVVCFAYHGGQIIGAGRALSDRLTWTVIFDLALAPEFQGRGLGRAILQDLQARAGGASTMLHSAPGKEPFYQHLGFRRMKTAMAQFAKPELARDRGFTD